MGLGMQIFWECWSISGKPKTQLATSFGVLPELGKSALIAQPFAYKLVFPTMLQCDALLVAEIEKRNRNTSSGSEFEWAR